MRVVYFALDSLLLDTDAVRTLFDLQSELMLVHRLGLLRSSAMQLDRLVDIDRFVLLSNTLLFILRIG